MAVVVMATAAATSRNARAVWVHASLGARLVSAAAPVSISIFPWNPIQRLIIADDNPPDRAFLMEILADFAPSITASADLAEPWLVTDIQMPELNGIELGRQLWARQPAARAAQTVFREDQCWVGPQVRRVQARTQQQRDALSDTEYEVLIGIALGLTDNAIAERRYLSRRGVQNRLQSLYVKLGANEAGGDKLNIRSRAVAIALQRGLVNQFEPSREELALAAWLDRK